jgi:transposase
MPIIWIAWLMGIPIKKRIGASDFLVDQAGWHLSTRLVVPANVTIITLPPKCPELNPVENVWQYIWLSNRIFKSHDDLVDIVARPGTSSSISLGASCPSDCANGRTSSDQWDRYYWQE